MLFNSHIFLFYFLPIVLIIFYVIKKTKFKIEILFLSIASLIFYSWNDPKWLLLLTFSIVTNFYLSHWIYQKITKLKLFIGVGFNIILIAWFKYRYFILGTFLDDYNYADFIIPLAISFFTFQQISFLVDIYDKRNKPLFFLEHVFYVSFFPQLIAGPIVLAQEMVPQIKNVYKKNKINGFFTLGIFVFFVGLFKKVFLADNIAPYVIVGFNNIYNSLTFPEAWALISAFALQLYFDFSGYSEMAVGLGLMFGFRLPVNFNTPFKALSMIDFWKRWHITVTKFFMLYLYAPFSLLLNRISKLNYSNNLLFLLIFPTMVTFFVSGLWHGADWKFIYFGLVNGLCLIINHLWKIYKMPKIPRLFAWFLTMVGVLVSFVFFRADNTSEALKLLSIMFNPFLIEVPSWMAFLFSDNNVSFSILSFFSSGTFTLKFLIIISISFILSLKIPNVADKNFEIINNWKNSFVLAILILLSLSNLENEVSFIYFQF